MRLKQPSSTFSTVVVLAGCSPDQMEVTCAVWATGRCTLPRLRTSPNVQVSCSHLVLPRFPRLSLREHRRSISDVSWLYEAPAGNACPRSYSTTERRKGIAFAARTAVRGGRSGGKGGSKGGASTKPRLDRKEKSASVKEKSDEPMSEQTKLANMREFAQDEKLLFTPVPSDAGAAVVRVIYAYPNTYTVGICSLGYQLVWRWLAESSTVHVARLFTDASEPLMRNPDLIGFSFSWELDYANVLALLEDLSIPTRAEDRDETHPLVFGGGPVLTTNPEPYSDFFDCVLLGDGEDMLFAFLDAVKATSGLPHSRRERLVALAQVPGVYVPLLYHATYEGPTGRLLTVHPVDPTVPRQVAKQTYRGEHLAMSSLVSPRMAWENIFMVEVVRSCPEMCRFCLASYVTLPFRSAPLEDSLIPSIQKGLQFTDRLGLLGASVTQHPRFDDLLTHLLQPELAHVRLSIASVRTNTVTPKLASALAARGTKSLTVAVESGSERVRRIINKKLDSADIILAAKNAEEGGLEGLKLYAMVGLPGEEDSDVDLTIEMMKDLKKAAPKLRLSLGCSTFVPKAHTPFQWYGVRVEGEKRMERLAKGMRQLNVEFRPESYKWSVVQALLSRGDRRMGRVLERVRGFGDSRGSFRRAFKEMEGEVPPMEFYVHRQMEMGEVLPWGHLLGPLPEATLVKHAQEAAMHF